MNEKINILSDENKRKDKRIEELEDKVNQIEQQMLINNVEIVNASTDENKTAKESVLLLAKASNFQLHECDVIDAYHLKNKNKIIAKFSSLAIKKSFVKRARESKLKKVNNPTADNAGRQNHKKSNVNIYINDQLTAFNKKLYWMTRTKIKSLKWKFSWVN